MTKCRIEERGHFDNGDTKTALYKDDRFIGYKTYLYASNYVLRDGNGNDEWVEVYQDGSTSRSTVGKQRVAHDRFVAKMGGLLK